MRANRYRPHLLVLPEDDANRQLANGFVQQLPIERQGYVQVLPNAGGWLNALTLFEKEHVTGLNQYLDRRIVLLIDFDDAVDSRRARFRESIPDRHADRVFVLGVRSEPENLKRALLGTTFEGIGAALAEECRAAHWDKWTHELLAPNADECARLRATLPGLFT